MNLGYVFKSDTLCFVVSIPGDYFPELPRRYRNVSDREVHALGIGEGGRGNTDPYLRAPGYTFVYIKYNNIYRILSILIIVPYRSMHVCEFIHGPKMGNSVIWTAHVNLLNPSVERDKLQ